MIIGVSEIELFIPGSNSLKAKRQVLKSLKARFQNKFNVSVAEVEHQDLWQRASLGIAVVSGDHKVVDSTLNKILDIIDEEPRVEVINYKFEKF